MRKLDNKEVKIEGLDLPKSIQIGIDNRNDNGNNHIYENGELKVLCSKCKEYHPVYHLEDGQWVDINKTYWVSKTRDTKEKYFGTKCIKCYKNKEQKAEIESKKVVIAPTVESKTTKEGDYLPHSKKNGGIQQTIFLVPELDLYLKLYGVVNGTKKNELINEIIAKFKDENPINL